MGNCCHCCHTNDDNLDIHQKNDTKLTENHISNDQFICKTKKPIETNNQTNDLNGDQKSNQMKSSVITISDNQISCEDTVDKTEETIVIDNSHQTDDNEEPLVLPDELIVEISRYLSLEDRLRCERVSKQWQQFIFYNKKSLILNRHLIQKMKNKMKNNTDKQEFKDLFCQRFETILVKCYNIRHFTFIDSEISLDLTDDILRLVTQFCHRLQSIDLNIENDISVQKIETFFDKFANQLIGISLDFDDVNDETENCFHRCVHRCHQLVYLIYCCTEINMAPIDFLNNLIVDSQTDKPSFARLKQLHISCDINTVAEPIVDHLKEKIETIANNYGKTLKILCIDFGLTRPLEWPQIKPIFIVIISMIKLQSLDIRNIRCSSESNKYLKHIGNKCKQLRELSLQLTVNNIEVMTDLLSTINNHFYKLKWLSLSGYSPNDYVVPDDTFNRCKQLKKLSLIFCQPICYQSFLYKVGHNLPKLEELSVSCNSINKQVFDSLSKLTKLRYLDLYGHKNSDQKYIVLLKKRIKICRI